MYFYVIFSQNYQHYYHYYCYYYYYYHHFYNIFKNLFNLLNPFVKTFYQGKISQEKKKKKNFTFWILFLEHIVFYLRNIIREKCL